MAEERDGPGQFDRTVKAGAREPAETIFLRLWNFDTGQALLKAGHKPALQAEMNRMLRREPRTRVFVRGLASRVASTRFNAGLGKRRAGEVINFLTQSGVPATNIEGFDFPGEEISAETEPNSNEPWDRAVEVQITFNLAADRTIRLPRPPLPAQRDRIGGLVRASISREFAIRLQISLAFTGAFQQVRVMKILIWDTSENMLAAAYDGLFYGIDLTFPSLPDLPADVSQVGQWSCFPTLSSMGVEDFSGTIIFGDLGAGLPEPQLPRGFPPVRASTVELTLMPLFNPPILIRDFDTGWNSPNTPNLFNFNGVGGVLRRFGPTMPFRSHPDAMIKSKLGDSCRARAHRISAFAR
jgi:hypothetical protein